MFIDSDPLTDPARLLPASAAAFYVVAYPSGFVVGIALHATAIRSDFCSAATRAKASLGLPWVVDKVASGGALEDAPALTRLLGRAHPAARDQLALLSTLTSPHWQPEGSAPN